MGALSGESEMDNAGGDVLFRLLLEENYQKRRALHDLP